MNVYIGILSLIICTFLGYRLSVKYTERKKFFSDFYNFNEKMINEVSFSQNSVLTLLKRERDLSRDFGKVLYDIISEDDLIFPCYIKPEEKELLELYVKRLGKSDRASQLVFLSSEKKIIDDIRSSVILDEKRYRKLYVKLGFLFGLIIFVALM